MLTRGKVSDTSQEEKQRVYVSWRRLIALCPGKLGRHEYRLVRVIRTGYGGCQLGPQRSQSTNPGSVYCGSQTKAGAHLRFRAPKTITKMTRTSTLVANPQMSKHDNAGPKQHNVMPNRSGQRSASQPMRMRPGTEATAQVPTLSEYSELQLIMRVHTVHGSEKNRAISFRQLEVSCERCGPSSTWSGRRRAKQARTRQVNTRNEVTKTCEEDRRAEGVNGTPAKERGVDLASALSFARSSRRQREAWPDQEQGEEPGHTISDSLDAFRRSVTDDLWAGWTHQREHRVPVAEPIEQRLHDEGEGGSPQSCATVHHPRC